MELSELTAANDTGLISHLQGVLATRANAGSGEVNKAFLQF